MPSAIAECLPGLTPGKLSSLSLPKYPFWDISCALTCPRSLQYVVLVTKHELIGLWEQIALPVQNMESRKRMQLSRLFRGPK